MVRRVLVPLAGLVVAVVLVVCACRSGLNFPPRLVVAPVSDTARLIGALPYSGAVYISKNGHRAFRPRLERVLCSPVRRARGRRAPPCPGCRRAHRSARDANTREDLPEDTTPVPRPGLITLGHHSETTPRPPECSCFLP